MTTLTSWQTRHTGLLVTGSWQSRTTPLLQSRSAFAVLLVQRIEVEGAGANCEVQVLGAALRADAKYMMNRIEDKVG